MKYYILKVFGGTDPEPLIGPFSEWDAMLLQVKKIYTKQREEDSIFWVSVGADNIPHVGSFSNSELQR